MCLLQLQFLLLFDSKIKTFYQLIQETRKVTENNYTLFHFNLLVKSLFKQFFSLYSLFYIILHQNYNDLTKMQVKNFADFINRH